MNAAVILLNFGEPESLSLEEVTPFLERIFLLNAPLEGNLSEERIRARSRELARERAPGLLEEYREIGGSPLNRQAREQAEALQEELRDRRESAKCYVGMQFTEPFITDVVRRARDDGADLLVSLPVYPLCGQTTTIASLEAVREAVEELEWDVPLREVTGWHRHPDFIRIHADNTRRFLGEKEVDLYAPDTRLLFSAHGTPVKYLKSGPRYVRYVEEACTRIARELGVGDYDLGYQNHGNRPVEWTSPDVDDVIREVEAERVVVLPVSFMHEQSETLAELDLELREDAEEAGLEFHRVPVPHDHPSFASVLADLVEPLLQKVPTFGNLRLKRCLCRATPYTFCLNTGN